jgi:hypothetical protein
MDDQPRRRDYQMQRLVNATALGSDADPVSLDALTLEWIAVGPVEPSAESALGQRFADCRAAVGARSGT